MKTNEMNPNQTPTASASRHTPERFAKAILSKLGERRGLDYRNIVQDEEIEAEIEHEIALMIAERDAIAGMEPGAVADTVAALERCVALLENIDPSSMGNEHRACLRMSRAALAALKGGAK